VKAAMLIRMLSGSGKLPLVSTFADTVFDMSVGYDLAGITSDRVQAFITGMRDARDVIERLRGEIPSEFASLRDLDYRPCISDTLTLSTFHGCPADEIERIIDHLFRAHRLHCIVKLNPMLLGPGETRHWLNDVLGYDELRVPERAFDRELTWDRMTDMVERLGATARSLGLGFGVKFTNTLVVENHRTFFPASERDMYLSGAPLHILAMQLVARFRERFGDRYTVSFSGGIDFRNFADAVGLGLVPVTSCTDLLKTGGYARARRYFAELATRMDAVGARTLDEFVARAPTARDYATRASADLRYHASHNRAVPRKIGSRLMLFDCITCDKCVPVCPNGANFTLAIPPEEIPVLRMAPNGSSWTVRDEGRLALTEKHQIGNFADFCNDCGNCDVFCPEDGGPYILKPRFFGTEERWRQPGAGDGFYVERRGQRDLVLGRFSGAEFRVEISEGCVYYSGRGFAVRFAEADPVGTIQGAAESEVDLTYYEVMKRLRAALFAAAEVNYINSLTPSLSPS
jgi:putative selenate reductase